MMFMRQLAAGLLAMLCTAWIAGCPIRRIDTCAVGENPRPLCCLEGPNRPYPYCLDGGMDDAGGRDAGTDAGPGDAGPCPMGCSGSTPHCGPANTCVACLDDTHCTTAAAARCDTSMGVCTTCTASTECAGITGTEVCETTGGACVECTPGERAACGTNVCDARMSTCSTATPNSTGLCQTCVADAQCMTGQLCVPMMFGSPATEVGTFCLWRQDATGGGAPNGDCINVRPYVDAAMLSSVEGTATTLCSLALSTCAAHEQFRMRSCTTPFTSDSECGVTGQDDAYCRMRSAMTNRCTVPCGSNDDCPSGFTCNTGATPRFCNF